MKHDRKSFKKRWRDGELLFGIFARLNSEESYEALGLTSVDVVVIDVEHGSFDRDRLSRCLFAAQAGGVAVLVRLPDMDPQGVQHAINIGADGILIPHVDSPDQLRKLARFAKTTAIERAFAGAGRASAQRTVSWPEFQRDLSERLLFIAQLDEPAGVGIAREVAAIEAVDGVFLGTIGFALAMGHQTPRGAIEAELEIICDAARSEGVPIAISLPEHESAGQWRSKGINLFVVDSDVGIMRKGIDRRLQEFRGALAKP